MKGTHAMADRYMIEWTSEDGDVVAIMTVEFHNRPYLDEPVSDNDELQDILTMFNNQIANGIHTARKLS